MFLQRPEGRRPHFPTGLCGVGELSEDLAELRELLDGFSGGD